MKEKYGAVVQALDIEKNFFCLNCGEAIYNPICPECLWNEIIEWTEKIRIDFEFIEIIDNFLHSHKNNKGTSQTCIICNQDNTYLCPYCFTDFVFEILKEFHNDNIAKDFLEKFNFDFGDFKGFWGYHKEAEKLGLFQSINDLKTLECLPKDFSKKEVYLKI